MKNIIALEILICMKTSLHYDICGIDEPLAVISIHEENETKKRYGLLF